MDPPLFPMGQGQSQLSKCVFVICYRYLSCLCIQSRSIEMDAISHHQTSPRILNDMVEMRGRWDPRMPHILFLYVVDLHIPTNIFTFFDYQSLQHPCGGTHHGTLHLCLKVVKYSNKNL